MRILGRTNLFRIYIFYSRVVKVYSVNYVCKNNKFQLLCTHFARLYYNTYPFLIQIKEKAILNVQKESRQVPVYQVLASYLTNYQHSVVYSSTAAWAAANILSIMLIVNYLRLDWSTFRVHFSCILHVLHVDVSYYFARIFILLQDVRSFCKNIHFNNKISLHSIFNF